MPWYGRCKARNSDGIRCQSIDTRVRPHTTHVGWFYLNHMHRRVVVWEEKDMTVEHPYGCFMYEIQKPAPVTPDVVAKVNE